MNINTQVFRRIIEEHRSTAIAKIAAVIKQTGRFAHLDNQAAYELATRAWNGEVDLDKETL